MSKGVGINPDAARKIQDDGSEFKLPDAARDELRTLSKEEWMSKYGDVLASEQYFERRDPNWPQNKSSWWYREAGRAGEEPPLWMRAQYHIPGVDCPPGGDRVTTPIDQRPDRPLWAERMNLQGNKQGNQSTTIYGHRSEYLPGYKSSARSMYERYQPAYQRVANEELPDTSDPPDGRFWKSGIAQGISTNPYEKRLAISGRRKPIVVGPRSISVVVDGEGHTLANAVRDVAWVHPGVEFVGYSLEHPVYRHVNLRVQTVEGGPVEVGAEQVLAESLELTQEVFKAMGEAMGGDVEKKWEKRRGKMEEKRREREEKARKREEAKEEKAAKWALMVEGKEPYDGGKLEFELLGKVTGGRGGGEKAKMPDDQEMHDAGGDGTTIVVEVNDEDHTFGNILRDVMWKHPHVTVAQYSQEMVVPGNQIAIQCQTSGAIRAEQGIVESLHMTKAIFTAIEDEMDEAVKRYNKNKQGRR